MSNYRADAIGKSKLQSGALLAELHACVAYSWANWSHWCCQSVGLT